MPKRFGPENELWKMYLEKQIDTFNCNKHDQQLQIWKQKLQGLIVVCPYSMGLAMMLIVHHNWQFYTPLNWCFFSTTQSKCGNSSSLRTIWSHSVCNPFHCARTHRRTHIHTYMCVCVSVYMWVCMYITCMYTHIYYHSIHIHKCLPHLPRRFGPTMLYNKLERTFSQWGAEHLK